MANLNKQVLGRLSGSVGDLVFRQRHGVNYACTKPGPINAANDPASIERRNKFALTCRFSHQVNSVPYLNTLWKRKLPAGLSSFNAITKTNYKFSGAEELSDRAVIVPDSGFGITLISSAVPPPNLQVEITPVGNSAGIDTTVEINICLCTIIALSKTSDELSEANSFITLVSAPQQTVLDAQLTFEIPYSKEEIELFNNYQDKKGFSALVTLDESENPVHYSRTFVLQ
jgi:hypothetical protein